MLVPGVVAETDVVLYADDMAHWTKADELPHAQKQIGVRPAIETQAERVWLEDPPNLRKSREHSGWVRRRRRSAPNRCPTSPVVHTVRAGR